MDHAINRVRRVTMRRWFGGFDAAALIDSDVDDHRAPFHVADHLARDQLRSGGARNEYAPDYKIGFGARLRNGVGVRS